MEPLSLAPITWTTETRRLGDLQEWEDNPRLLSKHDAEHIGKSIHRFGLADPLIINRDNSLIGGHQRRRILADPETLVDVRVPSRQLTPAEAEELGVRLNKNTGSWDFDILANNWEAETLIEWGFTEFELGIATNVDYNEAWKGMPEFEQEDKQGIIIRVHFANESDREEFFRMLGVKHTDKTKSFWYPERPEQLKNQLGTGMVYTDES
jgi:hypothetical protein